MRATPFAIRQLVDAVCRSISLDRTGLTGEFFPAHLPVALIDAFFPPRLQCEQQEPPPITERYCRHFGITHRRADRWELPPAEKQETLGDLIRHFDDHGVEGMTNEVFQARRNVPPPKMTRSEKILRAARALWSIGVEVLQDMQSRRPEEIEDALRPLPGIGARTVRLFLMFTGNEDFVRGDTHIRRFVASALGRRRVSAAQAEEIVRGAAHELILSPRFVDRLIWEYGVCGTGIARPPASAPGT